MKQSEHKKTLREMVREVDGCWLWQGARHNTGYGLIHHKGKSLLMHRVFYTLQKGKIPPGLEIDHLCRVRLCVNPDHLEAVTRKVNNLRGQGCAARNARKTHCPKGHEYTEETIYRTKSGGRQCRPCAQDYQKRRHAAQPPPLRRSKPNGPWICQRGHLVDGSNRIQNARNQWKCRACANLSGRRAYWKKKEPQSLRGPFSKKEGA